MNKTAYFAIHTHWPNTMWYEIPCSDWVEIIKQKTVTPEEQQEIREKWPVELRDYINRELGNLLNK